MSYSHLNRYKKAAPFAAVNDATIVVINDAASLVFAVHSVNAASGITLVLEGQISDDGPWVGMSFQASNATAVGTWITVTPAISTLPTNAWHARVAGYSRVRIRTSARTGGSVILATSLSDKPIL